MNLIKCVFILENKQGKFSLIQKSQDQDNQLFSNCPDQKNGYCSSFQSQDPKPLVIAQKDHMRLEAQRKEITELKSLLHRAREDVHVLQSEKAKAI